MKSVCHQSWIDDIRQWEQSESPEVVDKVHERQACQLFYQAWVHNIGSVAVALCVSIAVWPVVDHARLLLWLSGFVCIYVCRGLIAAKFSRIAPKGRAVHTWVRLQILAITASAIAYGLPAFFLWPADSPLEQMAWVITITAISAAAVARYCVWRHADLPFIVFALLPITFRLLLHGGLTYTVLGILGLMYSFVLLQIGRVMYTSNLENLLVGVKNEQLSKNLAQEIDKENQLNQRLVHEMEEREQAFCVLRQQEQELEQARRMEAIGLLSAGVAHELNSPLQFVGDNLHFIVDGLKTLGDFMAEVDTMKRSLAQGESAEPFGEL